MTSCISQFCVIWIIKDSYDTGHYTASINCYKNILLQRQQKYGVWNYWQQKLLYCICHTLWINWMLVTFGISFNILTLGIWCPTIPPPPLGCFLPLYLLSEYQIQHGAIGPIDVTSSCWSWIFCRGVSGFATDCPCGVWCRGLTTCLMYVCPLFGNRLLNKSWAVVST